MAAESVSGRIQPLQHDNYDTSKTLNPQQYGGHERRQLPPNYSYYNKNYLPQFTNPVQPAYQVQIPYHIGQQQTHPYAYYYPDKSTVQRPYGLNNPFNYQKPSVPQYPLIHKFPFNLQNLMEQKKLQNTNSNIFPWPFYINKQPAQYEQDQIVYEPELNDWIDIYPVDINPNDKQIIYPFDFHVFDDDDGNSEDYFTDSLVEELEQVIPPRKKDNLRIPCRRRVNYPQKVYPLSTTPTQLTTKPEPKAELYTPWESHIDKANSHEFSQLSNKQDSMATDGEFNTEHEQHEIENIPAILYRDSSHPDQQFSIDVDRMSSVMRALETTTTNTNENNGNMPSTTVARRNRMRKKKRPLKRRKYVSNYKLIFH